jgi:hypothetical protein
LPAYREINNHFFVTSTCNFASLRLGEPISIAGKLLSMQRQGPPAPDIILEKRVRDSVPACSITTKTGARQQLLPDKQAHDRGNSINPTARIHRRGLAAAQLASMAARMVLGARGTPVFENQVAAAALNSRIPLRSSVPAVPAGSGPVSHWCPGHGNRVGIGRAPPLAPRASVRSMPAPCRAVVAHVLATRCAVPVGHRPPAPQTG